MKMTWKLNEAVLKIESFFFKITLGTPVPKK